MNTQYHQQIEQFILDYIQENALYDNNNVSIDSDIVEDELLDSFAILSLIMSLESKFSVKFQTEELADKSIRVVKSLKQLVLDKVTHDNDNDNNNG